jgi:menaquinol-cytochrome c reductase iron-sulfur subunit
LGVINATGISAVIRLVDGRLSIAHSRRMPTPSDGSQDPRRGFLKLVTGLIGGVLGAVATLPGVALLLHPLRRETVKGGKEPLRVASLKELKPNQPLRVDIRGELIDAWSRLPDVKIGSCWLVKSPADSNVRAYSSVCPHLGCGIDWSEERKQFVCPCHDSYFSLDGKALTGPSPRDMDELPVAVQGEEVKVAYRRFRLGTPKKEEV